MRRPGGRAPRLRRWAARAWRAFPAAWIVAVAAAIGTGRLHDLRSCGWTEVAALAGLLLALAATGVRRIRRSLAGSPVRLTDDLELGLLLLALAESVALLGGGTASPLFPAVYLVMAFLVAFLRPAAGTLLTAAALGLDLLAFVGRHALPAGWPEYAAHAAFLTLFAVLYHLVLAAQILASRSQEKRAVARRLRQVDERAREYRLIAAGTENGERSPEGEARWVAASVREVEQAVGSALEIAESALHAHTCAVFLLSGDDRELKLQDCRSRSEAVRREPLDAGQGILGAVARRRQPVRLVGRVEGVNYYEGTVPVRSVLAVPLVDRRGSRSFESAAGFVRGVLVADRLEERPFGDDDERLLLAVGREVLRSIEVERVMGYVRRARDEKDRFYRAIEELNRASKPDEVFEAALTICRSILPLDFGAITLVNGPPGGPLRHRIVQVTGVHGGEALAGHEFADNSGLCADVVRYGTALPGSGVRLPERPAIFDGEAQLRGIQALKIFPLRVGDRVLGTLVAASRRKGAFDDDAVRMAEVVGLQVGEALQRAQLFAEVERMATTDGLTGLVNHRTFQNLLDQRLALARRYHKPLSFLLCDIDHFKQVNDGHGHPAGDAILKGVAKLLGAQARETDIVARYGGEEFALVLPETDGAAARTLAERIRAAVEATPFSIGTGSLRITLSLGLATFPETAEAKQDLIGRADQALYAAKRAGRNRWVAAEAQAGPAVARPTG
ncbi:MAG TPA: diguanylate cyclase [Myxococcales bacterium]|nr:diguanylate cyclase [Myxococcales bacterium]